MIRKIAKYCALVLAGIVLGILFRGPVSTWVHGDHEKVPGKSAGTSERKVLFWYDAMNPQNHYDKAG